MHELALADAVIEAALDVASREAFSRILRIDVRIGELQRIDREVFEFALRRVIPAGEPRLEATAIRLRVDPARFRCRPCGRAFGLDETPAPEGHREREAIHFVPELAHAYLRCPQCRSPDFEVTGGRGVSIAELEGE